MDNKTWKLSGLEYQEAFSQSTWQAMKDVFGSKWTGEQPDPFKVAFIDATKRTIRIDKAKP